MKKLLFILILLTILVVPSSAWLSGYTYRNEHYITGNTSWGASQTNYHITIDVYRSSGTNSDNDVYVGTNCQNDYDDIRFTDSSDNLLDYWIQDGYTSSAATIWIEYPTLTTGNNTLYMYYGNAGASAYTNGLNTFQLYDHFTGTSLNASQWSYSEIDGGSGSGSVSVSGSILTLTAHESWSGALVDSISTFAPNMSVKFYMYPTPTAGWGAGSERRYGFGDDTGDYAIFSLTTTSIELTVSGGNATGISYSPSNYGKYNIKATNPGATRYYYGTFPDNTIGISGSTTLVSAEPVELYEYSATGTNFDSYFDYVFVYNDNYYIPIHGVWSSAESTGTAAFSANVTYGPVNQAVLFTDTSTGSPSAWYWDFGDGNTSTSQNPTNTYGFAGSFDVTLNASYYGVNETELKVGYINIGQAPVASFITNVSSGFVPLSVLFTDTSSNGPTGWNWSFGDGDYSDLQSPSHEFDTSGIFTVIFNASSTYGYNITTGSINVTTSGNTTGAGIQYPPHQVLMIFKNRAGQPISDATVTITPTETSMGDWEWLYTLFGIDYENVPLDTSTLTATTGNDGSTTFLMVESARYLVTITKVADGVSDSWYIYPRDDTYIFVVYTTELPATQVPVGDVIDWDLGSYYLNDTYVYLNFTWTDIGATYADSINWYVKQDDSYIVNQTLAMSAGNASASYATLLGNDDVTYEYGFKVNHDTYGWINQSKTVVSHKQITTGLSQDYNNFIAFAFCAIVGLMFSRRNWRIGGFLTVCLGLVFAQVGILKLNNSTASTMSVLVILLVITVIIIIRGYGDKNV